MSGVINRYLAERTRGIVTNFISYRFRNAGIQMHYNTSGSIWITVTFNKITTMVRYGHYGPSIEYGNNSNNDSVKRVLLMLGPQLCPLSVRLMKDFRRDVIHTWTKIAIRFGVVKDVRIHMVKVYLLPYLLRVFN